MMPLSTVSPAVLIVPTAPNVVRRSKVAAGSHAGSVPAPENTALPPKGHLHRQTCVNCVEVLENSYIQGRILSHSICLKMYPWCAMGTAATAMSRCLNGTLE
jgi:hypothetical protein